MRANWGLTQGSLNMHGHKSSIISTYLVLCRNARSTILLTMFSLPFLSRRARDQVMHRRWNPLCLVTALLSTSQVGPIPPVGAVNADGHPGVALRARLQGFRCAYGTRFIEQG